MDFIGAALVLAWNLNTYLNVAALVGFAGAAFFALRFRNTIEAVKTSASAWREERDAEKAKAERLAQENKELEVRLAAAEARTDQTPVLEKIERLVAGVESLAAGSTERHGAMAEELRTNSMLVKGLVEQTNESTRVLRALAKAQEIRNGDT